MTAALEEKNSPDVLILLPILALCVDLFTPILIWKGLLPEQVRWASHLLLAAIILISLLRMLRFDRIPRAAWLVLAVTVLWSFVAIGHNQGILPTVWGAWLLFQFPFVALFIYLEPRLPHRLSATVLRAGLIVLGIEVVVQLIQYALGEPIGDNLAGIFGKNGTSNAVIFVLLICSLFFGHWIVSGHWQGLALALTLSVICSVLGEMKLFPFATLAIGILAAFIYALRRRKPVAFFLYGGLILVVVVLYTGLYNSMVPKTDRFPLQSYLDPTRFDIYMNRVATQISGTTYSTRPGRNYALTYGWESLQRDPLTFLFGYGTGARSESKSLGTSGVAMASSWSVGTSALIVLQEMGLVGVLAVAGFLAWLVLALIHDALKYPDSPVAALRIGLLLFSVLWPVWLWYSVSWTMRAPMLVYWLLVGYIFAESRAARQSIQDRVPTSSPAGA